MNTNNNPDDSDLLTEKALAINDVITLLNLF